MRRGVRDKGRRGVCCISIDGVLIMVGGRRVGWRQGDGGRGGEGEVLHFYRKDREGRGIYRGGGIFRDLEIDRDEDTICFIQIGH